MECGVLVKAFSLLDALDQPAVAMSLRDLALAAGLPRPTAHRILASLHKLGYIRKEVGGVYRLSRRAPGRSDPSDPTRLAAAAQPVVQRLNVETGETVNLGVLRGDRVVYLLVAESTHALRRVVKPGETDPFHTTALGRAIVAHLPDAQVQALLARLPRVGPGRSRFNANPFRRILATVRRNRHAVEQNQTDVGVTCVGVAIIVDGQSIGALSISAPTARLTLSQRGHWVKLLRNGATEISTLLSTAE